MSRYSSRPVRVTKEQMEKNLSLQAHYDQQQRDLAQFAANNSKLLSASNAEKKVETQRRALMQQKCMNDMRQEEEFKKQAYDKKFRELTISQNQQLAVQLDKDASDEGRRMREIQKICEESPELRELERMLKIAYLNKDRAAQHEEKIVLAMKEQERIQAIEEEMEAQRLASMAGEANDNAKKREKFEEQRAILQVQIDEKEAALAEARRQMMEERESIDQIIKKIHDEDMNDLRAKREKQEATAMMVRHFEEQRRLHKAAERAAAKEEEDRINEYTRAMEARGAGVAAKKQAKKEEEDRILAAIVEETERKRREQEEFNDLRDMLWEEELEAAKAAEAKERVDKQNRIRKEMMDANSDMLKQKKIQMQIDRQEEAKLIKRMKDKFAADEALERKIEQDKRETKLQHMRMVDKQRLDRKNMYEAEREQEYKFIEENEERERYRQKVIQEARKRLLEQHAQHLGDFIPAGAFADRSEMHEILSESQYRK